MAATTETTETVDLRLVLRVKYTPNGTDAAELIANLERMVQQAVGNGMLTGSSEAEVAEHSVCVTQSPAYPTEEKLGGFMLQRIESGDLADEDLPFRLARYGMMDNDAFVNEMLERMEGV